MKEFEHNINKILADAPDMQPSAKRLNAMREKIRAAQNPAPSSESSRKPFGFLWILLPAVLLSALLGGGVVYGLFHKQQILQTQQINTLQSQIAALSSDTVFVQRDIYHVDTVFRTIQSKEYINVPAKSSNFFAFNNNNNSNLLTNSPFERPLYTLSNQNLLNNGNWKQNLLANQKLQRWVSPDAENTAALMTTAEEPFSVSSNLEQLAYLSLEEIRQQRRTRFLFDDLSSKGKEVALPAQQKKSKKYINPLWSFIPTGATIGAKVGNVTLTDLGKGRHLNWHYGLAGEIHFGKNIRMIGGFEKINVDYVVEDELLFANYPRITAENPNDELHEIYVDLDYLQIPIGLKYVTRPDKKIRPFGSISLVARQAKKQRFTYEYISMFQEYYATRTFKSSPFTLQSWRAGLGVEVDLGKGFHLSMEGLYSRDYDLNVFEYVELNHWGMNVGLNYRLGKKK